MPRTARPRAVPVRAVPLAAAIAAALLALFLSACSASQGPPPEPDPDPDDPGHFFGENGIPLFSFSRAEQDRGGGGIGVNAFLWRASLDTLTFLPLASADPFGGVIITDWYVPPEAGGDERLKLTVYILDQRLRADGVRVAVFRQERDGEDWRDTAVASDTSTRIENAILTRAREMWLNSAAAR